MEGHERIAFFSDGVAPCKKLLYLVSTYTMSGDITKQTADLAPPADGKWAVVCVDDDPYVLQMLSLQMKDLLNWERVLLELLTDPTQTIGRIDHLLQQGYQIRCVITDYRMPQMTGYELIYALKTTHPAIPCVLLSGQADKFEVRELLHTGLITSFINKPWTLTDLKTALQETITG